MLSLDASDNHRRLSRLAAAYEWPAASGLFVGTKSNDTSYAIKRWCAALKTDTCRFWHYGRMLVALPWPHVSRSAPSAAIKTSHRSSGSLLKDIIMAPSISVVGNERKSCQRIIAGGRYRLGATMLDDADSVICFGVGARQTSDDAIAIDSWHEQHLTPHFGAAPIARWAFGRTI